MGFTKKTWKNRIAEYINRRLITMEDGSTNLVTVARDEGTISQEGDAFNAANMNDLEDRIEAGFADVSQSLKWSNVEIVSDSDFEVEFAKYGALGFISVVRNNNGTANVDKVISFPTEYDPLSIISVANYSSYREAFIELSENKLRIYATQGHWVRITALYPLKNK